MRRNKKEEITAQELDGLLGLVRDASLAEPSTAIRENLRRMAVISPAKKFPARTGFPWPRWAVLDSALAVLLLGIGLYSLPWLHRIAPPTTPAVSHEAHVEANHDPEKGAERPRSPRRVMVTHPRHADHLPLRNTAATSSSFDFTLPYSNPDIANGTATTIQVAVSREELFALGVPVNDGGSQSRYLAEVALGDDGLPRSIHVPLPLRTIH